MDGNNGKDDVTIRPRIQDIGSVRARIRQAANTDCPRSIHLNLSCRWRFVLAENPERAFAGNGNRCKYEARISELERLLGQSHAETELLKKAFATTQKRIQEERLKPMLNDDI